MSWQIHMQHWVYKRGLNYFFKPVIYNQPLETSDTKQWVLENKIETLQIQKRNLEQRLCNAEKINNKQNCHLKDVKDQNFNSLKLKLTHQHYTINKNKNEIQFRFAKRLKVNGDTVKNIVQIITHLTFLY